MKNLLLKRLLPAILLLTFPLITYADPNFDGLAEALIGIFIIALVFTIVSLVASIRYFMRGGQVAFYIALITGLILYGLFGFVRTVGSSSPLSLISIVALLPLGLLCYRPIKNKSTMILPYAAMNVIVTDVLSLFVFGLAAVLGQYRNIEMLSLFLSAASIALFTCLLTRALLGSDPDIPDSTLFRKGNLLVLLSFAISLASTLVSLRMHWGSDIGYGWGMAILKWLLPVLVVANITIWLTIRNFRNRTFDDPAGPPL